MGCWVVERHLEMAQPTKKQKKSNLHKIIIVTIIAVVGKSYLHCRHNSLQYMFTLQASITKYLHSTQNSL